AASCSTSSMPTPRRSRRTARPRTSNTTPPASTISPSASPWCSIRSTSRTLEPPEREPPRWHIEASRPPRAGALQPPRRPPEVPRREALVEPSVDRRQHGGGVLLPRRPQIVRREIARGAQLVGQRVDRAGLLDRTEEKAFRAGRASRAQRNHRL